MTGKELFYNRAKTIFGNQTDELMEKLLDEPLTKAFYLNELKGPADQTLNLIDFDYHVSNYNEHSYFYDYDNIGKTKANELGLIYPQEMSASIPAQVLNPAPNSLIVDMCSAPGGKTINLAILSGDSGLIIANEYEYKRAMILVSNLERMGISNVIVTNKDCSELAEDLYGLADYVLLDAPCSGEGMIRKTPTILEEYNLANINLCATRQQNLIENAYDILKPGGRLVYSTCTYAVEENEAIVKEFLAKHPDMELLNVNDAYPIRGVEIEAFESDKVARFNPLIGTEGQFVALMHKKGDGDSFKCKYRKPIKQKLIDEFIKNELDLKDYYLYEQNERYYLSLKPLIDMNKHVLRYGIYVGEIKKNIFYPSHHLYRANSLKKHFKHVIDLDEKEYYDYLKGLSIFKDVPNGHYLLTHLGYSFAYGKVSAKQIKNKYPKGLRW